MDVESGRDDEVMGVVHALQWGHVLLDVESWLVGVRKPDAARASMGPRPVGRGEPPRSPPHQRPS